jgi:hypothetical protein
LQVVNCSLPASVAVICLFDILTVQNNRLWVVMSHASDNVFSETCLHNEFYFSFVSGNDWTQEVLLFPDWLMACPNECFQPSLHVAPPNKSYHLKAKVDM